jgi:ZIP family zinc transporter
MELDLGFMRGLHPVVQALIGTTFTWAMTAFGAAAVFLRKHPGRNLLNAMLGFAAGVMIAASFWSLLAPAIAMTEGTGVPKWFPALVGFLAGGIFLRGVDKLLPHLHPGFTMKRVEGIHTRWPKSTLLVLAITLHNFPEGLALGVAFGAAAAGYPAATLAGAVALAIGIGIQDIPEGLAVSMPLRRDGFSRFNSFFAGQLSGLVEPLAGVIGAVAVVFIKPILPYAMAFSAGAMIFVAVEEAIPESQSGGNTDIATLGTMLGFALMMFLDVAFG